MASIWDYEIENPSNISREMFHWNFWALKSIVLLETLQVKLLTLLIPTFFIFFHGNVLSFS